MNKAFAVITAGAVALLVGIFLIAGNGANQQTSNQPVVENPHELRAEDHIAGNPEAKIVLIEYGDFQCPACAAAHPHLTQLKEELGDQVAIVWRHLPLTSIHAGALPAAKAAEAAARQDKFWEMHDLLFERQNEWARSTAPESFFSDYARELRLDIDQFQADTKDAAIAERINADLAIANQLGAASTPTFYLNGTHINNPATYEQLKSQIVAELP